MGGGCNPRGLAASDLYSRHQPSFITRLSLELFSCAYIYFVKLFRRLKIDNFDFNSMCRGIAEKTKGLSGREIAKLAVSWQVSSLIIIAITFNPTDRVSE